MTVEQIKKYSEIAYNILNNNKNLYSVNKRIISELFQNPKRNDDTIFTRLCVIDSFYSTNISSKRYFGISDLTQTFSKYSDEELKKLFNDCIHNFNSNLFPQNIGIKKNGYESGHAYSLISKYAYFLTKYNFPIYDSIVKENLTVFLLDNQKFSKTSKDIQQYFKLLALLNNKTGVPFEKIDNLIWLYGKIKMGKLYYLFSTKEEYSNFIKALTLDTETISDNIIAEALLVNTRNNIKKLNKVLSPDLIEFIQFVFTN